MPVYEVYIKDIFTLRHQHFHKAIHFYCFTGKQRGQVRSEFFVIYKEADKTEMKKIPVTGSSHHAGRGALGKVSMNLLYTFGICSCLCKQIKWCEKR